MGRYSVEAYAEMHDSLAATEGLLISLNLLHNNKPTK